MPMLETPCCTVQWYLISADVDDGSLADVDDDSLVDGDLVDIYVSYFFLSNLISWWFKF